MSLPKICTCPTVPAADCPFHHQGFSRPLEDTATELFSALQRLLRAIEADYELAPTMDVATAFETNSQAIEQARAAIAKALGQN